MSWLKRTLASSIGGKLIVSLTGIGMVGFLVAHLSGNLLYFAGPEAMSEYAAGLRKFPLVLNGLRGGLIISALLHVSVAIRLNMHNRAARPVPYTRKQYEAATFASRSMVLTGSLMVVYIFYHLRDFTWRLGSPEIAALGPWDCHRMLVLSFTDPIHAGLYVVAMIVLGLHLSHGVSSLFQTLGLNHHKYNGLFRLLGPLAGLTLAGGFISIPVAVMLGIGR